MLRTIARPLLLTPLALLGAACAQEADPGALELRTGAAAVSALRAAPDAATEAGTARFEMVMEMAMLGETFEVTASGAFDAGGQMALTMDMGSVVDELAAGTDETVPDGFSDPWEVVADGDTIYMKVPMLGMMLGDVGWISMTPDDLGADASDLGLGAGAFDPSKMLESLRGVGGEPQVVGEEAVRGVETTHYRVEIDLADALAAVPESERESVEASLEQLGDLSGAVIPVDVWIDADDLPRRLQMDMTGAFGELTGEDAGMTMTMEVFDYGADVDIEVPPADEVTPFSEVLGGLGDFGAIEDSL
jgi:hypothetical protein